MLFDLATAKERLGIDPGDTAQDATIQGALDTSLALAELYCQRKFNYAADSETFSPSSARRFSLRRYPIDAITLVTSSDGVWSSGADMAHNVDQDSGIVVLKSYVIADKVTIDYTGGFDPLPDDLVFSLWAVFDATFPAMSDSGGGSLSGTLKKIAITGVGSIDYGTGGEGSSSAFAGMGDILPPTARAILSMYRRDLV